VRCSFIGSAPTSRCPASTPNIWEQVFRSQAGGILGMFNMFAGGGIHRMAIFALNIMPYISASIIIQLLTTVSPQLEALKKEGEAGRKTLNQYTRYLTVILAAFQSYGIAVGLEGAGNVVSDPGLFFRLSTAITLTGGHHVLDVARRADHLARHRQRHFADHSLPASSPELPSALASMLELGRQGALSTGLILVVIVMAVAVIAFIVFMERAPAAAFDPVSEASGRQQDVRGPILASAAQAQYLRRDSADLRILAAALADHGCEFECRQGPGMVSVDDHAALPRPPAVFDSLSGHDRCSSPSSIPRSCSTRPRPRTISRSTAASFRAFAPASAPPNTSTTSCRASRCWARFISRSSA